MRYMDSHPDIVEWNSEECPVKYIKPTDLKVHTYWPDMLVRRRGPDGQLQTIMVELKHSSELKEPQAPKTAKGKRRFLNEVITYNVNAAKWAAARAYCADRGWQFMVLDEKPLGKTY
jgi:hypothetical protein